MYDTSVYQTLRIEMGKQAPAFEKPDVQNSAAWPLTLASASNLLRGHAGRLRRRSEFPVGYAQTWQLAGAARIAGRNAAHRHVSRDQGNAGPQEFLPNNLPDRRDKPVAPHAPRDCLLHFPMELHARSGQVQLRRRLHNGLTATLQYTYSKSIDDDSLLGGQGATITTPVRLRRANSISQCKPRSATTQGAPAIAQNWLDLPAERGFPPRSAHLLNAQLQYTTGMALAAAR